MTIVRTDWDRNHTYYHYIEQFEGQFFVGTVMADANGGAFECPLWVDAYTGYAVCDPEDYEGEVEFAYECFGTLQQAMDSIPDENWIQFQVRTQDHTRTEIQNYVH